MTTEINILYELQKIDNEIISMDERKSRIPQEIEDAKEALQKAEEELKASQERFEDYKKNIKLKEGEIEDLKEKIVKSRIKQNEVKTNEEYRALIKEVEHLNSKIDSTEEEILIMMDESGTFKEDISKAKSLLEEEKKKHQVMEEEKKNELENLEKSIAEKREKREKSIGSISKEKYNEYEKLMKKRSSRAVSVIDIEGFCPECSVLIPPQTVNEVIMDEEIKNCPNCHRMLYYSENEEG